MDEIDVKILLMGIYLATIIGGFISIAKMSLIPLMVIPAWIILWLILLGGMKIIE